MNHQVPGRDGSGAPAAVRPDRAQVRADVVEAARAVFWAQGYHGATMESIARRAGYSKGAVYSNFESKSDLFLALLADDSLVSAGRAAVMAADEVTGSLETVDPLARCDRAALAAARGVVELAAERRPSLVLAEFRAQLLREPSVRARAAESRRAVVRALARWLDEGLSARGLRPVVPIEQVAVVVLSLLTGLALEGVDPGGTPLIPPESLSRALRGLIEPDPAGGSARGDGGDGAGAAR